jgi:hypothetical protein
MSGLDGSRVMNTPSVAFSHDRRNEHDCCTHWANRRAGYAIRPFAPS